MLFIVVKICKKKEVIIISAWLSCKMDILYTKARNDVSGIRYPVLFLFLIE